MPRKSTSKASSTKAGSTQDTPNRRSGLRTPTAKKPAKEPATPASEPKRSRRSSTAAQTAASQADSKKTRSHARPSDSPEDRSGSGDENTSRSTRRPMRKVNYEESDGEEDSADKSVGKEDDYNAEEDNENDSDSLDPTSKKKGKLKSPSMTKNSEGRDQNTRSSKAVRSTRKKAAEVGEDGATETPNRRGRAASEKADTQEEEEEKPKGGTRSKRSAATASPATSPTGRPSRASRQRRSTGSVDKPETPKPVRSSTRARKTRLEPQENEEEEEEEEEIDEKSEELKKSEYERSKKRKLDQEDDEEGITVKKTKIEDETPNDLAHSEDDSKKTDPEEKEQQSEEPMEVEQADNDEKSMSDAEQDEESADNDKSELSLEKTTNEIKDVPENVEDAAEAKSDVEDTKEDSQDPSEELEEEREEAEEDDKSFEDSEEITLKDAEASETSEDLKISANQNSPAQKQSPTKQNSSLSAANSDSSGLQSVAEEPVKSMSVVSDSPKATKCESFQSNPVNGTSTDDTSVTNTNKSEPTQMLPSSAVELSQQQLATTKPESDVIRVSANGHVTDDKSNVDAPTNDCSSGLLHGRLYFANRSPCAEALSRHRERTFGLVSFNLESTKVDDKFCLELKSVVSDIVCIQGINQEVFSEQLEPCFSALGFKGTFAQDESRAVATFYRSSLFQLKSQKKLTLKQTIVKDLERSMTPGEVSVVAEKIPPCGQVLFTHLGLTQSTRAVMIANVLVPPSDVSLQALQMSSLAQEAVVFLEFGGVSGGVPLVFCGAFNMEQQEAAYQLLRDGYLSNEMIETLQSKKELKLPGRDEDTSLVNLLWKSFQHTTSGLKSCYSAVTGQELVLSSQGSVRTSPDLIWFTSDSLTPTGVLHAPTTPTEHHLLLKANLAFNY